jgi:ribonuclease BN (tRNA processing enzyme)
VGLTITVLGCTGSYPEPDGACSGYLLESETTRIMVDAGPGTLANLQRHISIDELDAVVLSHSHPDHWTDLMVLRTAWKWGFDLEHLRVLGTGETKAMAEVVAHLELEPTFTWEVIKDGYQATIGDIDLSFSRTDHYVETLALRAECGGRSLAYSADTGPRWSFEAFAAPIALAMCEATYPTDEEAGDILHLSAERAGSMARAAGVERLVLTHLEVGADPAAYQRNGTEHFGAPVEVARVGARYEA